jgi:hypothetical protein
MLAYMECVVNDCLQAQLKLLQQDNGGAELDEEIKAAVAKAYRTKMKALELLHYQLGHLPYKRIERLIRPGVIPGYVVDKKLLRKVQGKTCKVRIESKLPGPSHKRHLPVWDSPWRRLAMDLSARFHSVSYHGNYYQMAIIET